MLSHSFLVQTSVYLLLQMSSLCEWISSHVYESIDQWFQNFYGLPPPCLTGHICSVPSSGKKKTNFLSLGSNLLCHSPFPSSPVLDSTFFFFFSFPLLPQKKGGSAALLATSGTSGINRYMWYGLSCYLDTDPCVLYEIVNSHSKPTNGDARLL